MEYNPLSWQKFINFHIAAFEKKAIYNKISVLEFYSHLVLWCSKIFVFTFGQEQKDRSLYQAFQNFYNLFCFILSPYSKYNKPPLIPCHENYILIERHKKLGPKQKTLTPLNPLPPFETIITQDSRI
jgi:hypothetical protein